MREMRIYSFMMLTLFYLGDLLHLEAVFANLDEHSVID